MPSPSRSTGDTFYLSGSAVVIGIIALLCISTVAAQPYITSVSPAVAERGKTTDILLKIAQWQPGTQISISPGGPYRIGGLALENSPHYLSRDGDTVFAANSAGAVYRIQLHDGQPHLVAEARLPGHISHFTAYDDTLISIEPGRGAYLWHWPVGKSPALSSSLRITSALAGLVRIDDQLILATQDGEIILCSIQGKAGEAPRLRKQRGFQLHTSVSAFTVQNQLLYFTGPSTGLGIVHIQQDAEPVMLGSLGTRADGGAIEVLDGKAYVADRRDGLVVYDVSKPDAIRWLGSNSKSGGLTHIQATAGHVYGINRGTRLLSLDIRNSELPITGSYVQLKSTAHDIINIERQLIVATDDGIQLVDFTHEAALQISNEGINHGGSRRGFIRNGIAYVADWFSGLHLYDIRQPRQLRHLGNYHTPGSSKGVVVDGDYAYVGDDDHGLQILDISDPSQPKKIAEVLSTGLAYTLVKRANLIYLADHRGGFHIIDVADPAQPRIIGSFDTPGKSWAIDVKGRHAYVADDASGLLIFDVANPAKIHQIAQFNPGGQAEDVVIQGELAHLTFFDGGYSIVDISAPQHPRQVGSTRIPGNARAVRLQGNYAFIAAWEGGLQVVDITDVRQPKVVAALDTDGSTWGLDIDGDYAFLWDWWGGVKVADISEPLQPRMISRYQASSPIRALASQGNFLYTAHGSRGMQVYDINNPINPIWATGLDLPGVAQDIAVSGKYAYLAMGDAGIAVANIENPFQVRWSSGLNAVRTTTHVRAYDGRLVAANTDTLYLIDVQVPRQPRLVKQLSYQLNDLWLDDTTLLLSSKDQGLLVFDISNLDAPRLLAKFTGNKDYQLVRSRGDLIALVVSGQGIQLLKRNASRLEALAFVQHPQAIQDIQFLGDDLYIASELSGLHRVSLIMPSQPQFVTSYPPTGPMQHLLVNEEAAFFAGDTSITSTTLLPAVRISTAENAGQLRLSLPQDMPLGTYHINLIDQHGVLQQNPNAFQVRLPKPTKPKFSMEDFKRILEQQRRQQH